jgi:acyl-CoA synthetase (AMP-forming)/AMP-acid ligase II
MGLDAPETIERYQKTTGGCFYTMYGQTETSCLTTMGRYDDCPGSAGRPVPLGLVELVDEADHPVPTGQVGEITLKGPMVFKGYWNLDEDNAHTFRNGRHHTGDLGRFDEDGFLWYAGRKPEKELIKPGGENVYPAEVEKVILDHPAVNRPWFSGTGSQMEGRYQSGLCVESRIAPHPKSADRICRQPYRPLQKTPVRAVRGRPAGKKWPH